MTYEFVVHGKVPSKSNCYKIITIGGHSSLAKTAAVKDFEKNFFVQCPYRSLKKSQPTILGYFSIDINVFYENMRPDVDNACKVILDCLQSCNVIKNDRYCLSLHIQKFVDKVDPRIQISISDIEV